MAVKKLCCIYNHGGWNIRIEEIYLEVEDGKIKIFSSHSGYDELLSIKSYHCLGFWIDDEARKFERIIDLGDFIVFDLDSKEGHDFAKKAVMLNKIPANTKIFKFLMKNEEFITIENLQTILAFHELSGSWPKPEIVLNKKLGGQHENQKNHR